MKIKTAFIFALTTTALTTGTQAFSTENAKTAEVHWSYEGETGPTHWQSLNHTWESCGQGHEQSPIDLRWKKPREDRSLAFFYNETPAEIVDNGHTIQINLKPGSKVEVGGQVYDLVQFHFHAESEHTLSNKHFPLELHLVHKDEAGHLAVIAVMFKVGAENEWIAKLWKQIPHEKEKAVTLQAKTFNPAKLLPASNTHYHYMGSLTTPPCTEGVNWNVLNTPVELSENQLKAFQKLYPHNNRPVQALFTRRPANY